MSIPTTTVTSSTSVYTTRGFWERLWRMSGIHSVALFIIAFVLLYSGYRVAILVAAVLAGMAVLNLLWFAAGVAAVVLVLLGGTTWLSDGFWAPDGAYSRFVSPLIGLVWVLAVSRILLTQTPATRTGW